MPLRSCQPRQRAVEAPGLSPSPDVDPIVLGSASALVQALAAVILREVAAGRLPGDPA